MKSLKIVTSSKKPRTLSMAHLGLRKEVEPEEEEMEVEAAVDPTLETFPEEEIAEEVATEEVFEEEVVEEEMVEETPAAAEPTGEGEPKAAKTILPKVIKPNFTAVRRPVMNLRTTAPAVGGAGSEERRLLAIKEAIETERAMLEQSKRALVRERKALEDAQKANSADQPEASQAEVEDLYVQIAELKARLKKALENSTGEGGISKDELDRFNREKEEVEAMRQSLLEEKATLREREEYLNDCELIVMEKTQKLEEKAAELEQLKDEQQSTS